MDEVRRMRLCVRMLGLHAVATTTLWVVGVIVAFTNPSQVWMWLFIAFGFQSVFYTWRRYMVRERVYVRMIEGES
jgi:hypothetical protein